MDDNNLVAVGTATRFLNHPAQGLVQHVVGESAAKILREVSRSRAGISSMALPRPSFSE